MSNNKGKGGLPSKNHGMKSGKGRDNNPPKTGNATPAKPKTK
jgi:hypothetical protein